MTVMIGAFIVIPAGAGIQASVLIIPAFGGI